MCPKNLRKRPLSFSKDAALVEVARNNSAHLLSVAVVASDDPVCAQLLGDRLGDTRKLDGFRRLDHLTHAIEEDRDPLADSSAALSHERKISASLGGRTKFDDRGSKTPADQGEKKAAFYIRFLADGSLDERHEKTRRGVPQK